MSTFKVSKCTWRLYKIKPEHVMFTTRVKGKMIVRLYSLTKRKKCMYMLLIIGKEGRKGNTDHLFKVKVISLKIFVISTVKKGYVEAW